MSLYCLKCKKWAYKTHKCNIFSIIPLSRECRGIVNKLHDFGFELLSAGCFTAPVSLYEHSIIVDIEFRFQYPTEILGDFPTGWKWYKEIVGTNIAILSLSYAETYKWIGDETIYDRINDIIDSFEEHLSSREPEAIRALLMLVGYDIGK